MSERSDRWIDLFFEDVPYSRETIFAKERVRDVLSAEEREKGFAAVSAHYHSLDSLASLAGYSAEDALRWRGEDQVSSLKCTKRSLRRGRWLAYLISLLWVVWFTELLRTICNVIYFDRDFLFTLAITLLCGLGSILAFRKMRSDLRQRSALGYDALSYSFLRDFSDKYLKRLLNSIALFFAAFALFEMSEWSFYVFGNSKTAELAENIFTNLLLVMIPLFLIVKNALCLNLCEGISQPDRRRLRRHLFWLTIFSAGYWGVSSILSVVFSDRIAYPINFFLGSAVLFSLLIFVYNYTLRKEITYRNFVINKPRIALVMIVVFLVSAFFMMNRDTWYTQTYINSVPAVSHTPSAISYNERTGVYTLVSSEEDFKILHLTDVHLGGSLFSRSKDLLALRACFAEIEHTHPDLVVVTGDLCFPMGVMSLSFNNSAPVHQFAAFMRNVGIPWAFTYGNHDTESLASMRKEELDEVYKSLSFKTSANLLYPYVQPRITGRNNQLIEVRNEDGRLNTALFLLDSNAYTGEGFNTYDYIHDDQVDWYEGEVKRLQSEEGGRISSLVFFHIPLIQYRTAYELYLAGSDEVTYHFGENNEELMQQFNCSEYDSALFERMVALGSTTGTFCGHDHYNNASITYRGIRLTYGMSIDYLAMPGISKDDAQRGAELITLHADSSWDVRQIPLSSIL